jgi:hypothetical protein
MIEDTGRRTREIMLIIVHVALITAPMEDQW